MSCYLTIYIRRFCAILIYMRNKFKKIRMFLVKFVNCVSERQQASKMCKDNVRIKFRLYKMLDFTLETLSLSKK